MHLTFTLHVDRAPREVTDQLERAVSTGLDAAAERLNVGRDATRTEATGTGLRVIHGVRELDGSEIRVSGTDRLTTLEIAVPWSDEDAGSPKLWAANRFAAVVVDEVSVAA